MPKRGENIYKRKDNRWEGRYAVVRPDGRKKYVSVYAKTYAEAREKLRIGRENSRRSENYLPECRLTVKNLLQQWLAAKYKVIKLSSYIHYENIVNKQIVPGLGELPLNKLTAKKLLAFLNQKQQSGRLNGQGGLSPKTVSDMLSLIKAAVKAASLEYDLPQAAAIAQIKAPSCKQGRIDIFSEPEVQLLCQNILQAPSTAGLAVLLSLGTGLRLGEICALQWQDIDFVAQVLTVRRSVQRTTVKGRSRLLIQTPKSESSRRTIPLTAEILLLLQGLKKRSRSEYVFGAGSRPLEPRTLQYRFAALLQKSGIGKRSFHTLRHTFASRYVAAGADAKSLSELLGHSKVNITMQLYVHPTIEQKRANLETLNILRELSA